MLVPYYEMVEYAKELIQEMDFEISYGYSWKPEPMLSEGIQEAESYMAIHRAYLEKENASAEVLAKKIEKDIINEIKWAQVKERVMGKENEEYFEAMRIYPDGTEYAVEHDGRVTWKRADFVQLPFNPEHLQPEEWERRFKVERTRVLRKLREERA